jgi:hypothetical protein
MENQIESKLTPMKPVLNFRTTDRQIPVTIVTPDEVKFIVTSWLRKSEGFSLPVKTVKRRIAILSRSTSRRNMSLYKLEVEWLYEYWAERYFNEGKEGIVGVRLKYCEKRIGRKQAKILLRKITTGLHEQNLREAEDAEDVPFPISWGDSDYADNN